MANIKTKKRHSQEELLRTALMLLAELSVEQLTIESLCSHLNVTKGSFYHHFKGRKEFLTQLLEYWVEEWTVKVLQGAQMQCARERFEKIVLAGHSLPGETETAIRAWAQRDPVAHEYLARVDAMRMKFLEAIFSEATGDRNRAHMLSKIGYALFVGTKMMVPPVAGEERAAIVALMRAEVYKL